MRIVLLRGVRSLIIRSHCGALMTITYISYSLSSFSSCVFIEEDNDDHWQQYS